MIRIPMNTGGHQWEKTNLVTLQDKEKRGYDSYRCKGCGLRAKRYRLDELTINDRFYKKVARCQALNVTQRIKITRCAAVGSQFANLTPGSIHNIISAPTGYDNKNGEWVMGVGEPVKVLYGEFEYITD